MRKVLRVARKGKVAGLPPGTERKDVDTRVALMQALIRLGLRDIGEVLRQEVAALAGPWSTTVAPTPGPGLPWPRGVGSGAHHRGNRGPGGADRDRLQQPPVRRREPTV